jgi:hypothetical protein
MITEGGNRPAAGFVELRPSNESLTIEREVVFVLGRSRKVLALAEHFVSSSPTVRLKTPEDLNFPQETSTLEIPSAGV